MTVEKTAVTAVAGLMAIAARTAPKAKGQDEILISVLTSARQKELSRAMTDYGTQHGLGFFLRDAKNVAASDACLVVGVRGNVSVGINCGACGYATCAALEKATQKKRPTTTAFAGPTVQYGWRILVLPSGQRQRPPRSTTWTTGSCIPRARLR